MFTNIAIIAVKSERLIKISGLTAKLFPSAAYHIVSVVPIYYSRPILSTIHRDIFEEIAENSLEEVEVCIQKFNVLSIKKVKLYGRPEEVLLRYITKNKIDLAVLTAGVAGVIPFKLSGKVRKTLIARSPSSLLLYSSASKEVKRKVSSLLIIIDDALFSSSKKVLALISYLGRREAINRVTGICSLSEAICRQMLNKIRELIGRNTHIALFVVKDSRDFYRAYTKMSLISDLVIGYRARAHIKELLSPTPYQVNILELSRAPVLLL